MSLAPGTLCLFKSPHPRAGASCTVVRQIVPGEPVVWRVGGPDCPFPADCEAYVVELSSGERPPGGHCGFAAFRRELLPIAGPGSKVDVDQAEPVAA